MNLTLYTILLAISLFIVFLGFYRTEHTELGVAGFFMLFFLSLVMITGDIQHQTGEEINTSFIYDVSGNLTDTYSINTAIYTPLNFGGTLSHTLGYLMAVMSVIGFIGVVIGLKHSRRYR